MWDIRNLPFMPLDAEGRGTSPPEMMWANMNGRLVFKNAVERMIGGLAEVCWAESITFDDIDLFLFHQANLRINQYVQQQLKIPSEKAPINIDRFGNTTAGTIPILMAESVRNGTLKKGMKVATVAFGSGFTWGAAIIDW